MGEDEGGRSEQVHAGGCLGIDVTAALAANGASSKDENERKTDTGRAEGCGLCILSVYRDELAGAAGLLHTGSCRPWVCI